MTVFFFLNFEECPLIACRLGCPVPARPFERARIQTFPADYKWIGSKTDVEQMIGNAVPVNLARFVGETAKDFLEARNG